MSNREESLRRCIGAVVIGISVGVFALPAAADGPGDPAWVAQMLAAHNSARATVGAPPLTWSAKLSAYAQDWAQSSAAQGNSAHRTDNTYGENLFWTSGTATPGAVVAAWVSEVKDYNYAANSCSAVCGHYTQVVWKNTT